MSNSSSQGSHTMVVIALLLVLGAGLALGLLTALATTFLWLMGGMIYERSLLKLLGESVLPAAGPALTASLAGYLCLRLLERGKVLGLVGLVLTAGAGMVVYTQTLSSSPLLVLSAILLFLFLLVAGVRYGTERLDMFR